MSKVGLFDGRTATLPYQDGYAVKAYQNFAALGSIPQDHRFAGLRAYTLNERTEWVLDPDRVTWHESVISPNFDIQSEIDETVDEIAYLYISSAGSDATGDGSQARPFRQIDRCFQAIHVGTDGFIEIRALDAGPFEEWGLPPSNMTGSINIVGGGSSILNLISMPAGTRDANPTGGTKAGRIRHVVGAHAAITNGSHWIRSRFDFGGGKLWTYGHTIDGENSPSPDLNIIAWNFTADITLSGFSEIDLVPFISTIVPKGSGTVVNLAAAPTISITVAGFSFANDNVTTRGPVSLQGCSITSTFGLFIHPDSPDVDAIITNVYSANGVVVVGTGSNSITIVGLYKDEVIISAVHAFFRGVVRTTNLPKMLVGFGSATGPRKPTSVNLQADFELAGAFCIYAPGGSVRIFDDGTWSTVDGYSEAFIQMWNHGDLVGSQVVPSIYGSTTGVPIVITESSNTLGLNASGYGSSPYLRNSGTPGNDVSIGSGASSITVSFADLPATELNTASRAS